MFTDVADSKIKSTGYNVYCTLLELKYKLCSPAIVIVLYMEGSVTSMVLAARSKRFESLGVTHALSW
jgi:hypothetical protein